MKKKYLLLVMLLSTELGFFSCNRDETNTSDKPFVYYPAGRSFLGSSSIEVFLNSVQYPLDILNDEYGGYWIRLSRKNIPQGVTVEILYTRRQGPAESFSEQTDRTVKWTQPAKYIDCTDSIIIIKSAELVQGTSTNKEKALKIQQFIVSTITYTVYENAFLENASRTLARRYGLCINFSRLFIALCRAAHVPARSVWGIVYGYSNDNVYDYHHQWAEFLDENGIWHPLDFNYTKDVDITDVRYLDLLYSAEENPILVDNASYSLELGNVTFFNGYPAALTGKLGFTLVEDRRPDSMTVRFVKKY